MKIGGNRMDYVGGILEQRESVDALFGGFCYNPSIRRWTKVIAVEISNKKEKEKDMEVTLQKMELRKEKEIKDNLRL